MNMTNGGVFTNDAKQAEHINGISLLTSDVPTYNAAWNSYDVFIAWAEEQEKQGLLVSVFKDGKLLVDQKFSDIRNRIWS